MQKSEKKASFPFLSYKVHFRNINNQINKLYERALRLAYNNKSSSFQELLKRDKSLTIHERNIQVLSKEILKVENRIPPEIITKSFKLKDYSYDWTKNNCIKRRIIKPCKYDSENVSNVGSKLWDILPENILKS